jgi:hypothetical protein
MTFRFDIVRISALTIVVLGVLGITTLFGQARVGLEPTYSPQDPAQPASPSYVSLIPDSLDFGDQVVGRTSSAKRITVKNPGGSSLYVDSVNLGGDNPSSFAVLKDTCTGAKVDPDRACTIDVTFTPSRTGGRNARLKISDNALDSPQRLRLKGNGINSNDVPPF